MSDRLLSAEKLVEQFSTEELGEFANWFAHFQDQLWEGQIERDSLAGRLDSLINRAHAEFDAGQAREL